MSYERSIFDLHLVNSALPKHCTYCLSVFDHFVGLTLKGLTDVSEGSISVHILQNPYT